MLMDELVKILRRGLDLTVVRAIKGDAVKCDGRGLLAPFDILDVGISTLCWLVAWDFTS